MYTILYGFYYNVFYICRYFYMYIIYTFLHKIHILIIYCIIIFIIYCIMLLRFVVIYHIVLTNVGFFNFDSGENIGCSPLSYTYITQIVECHCSWTCTLTQQRPTHCHDSATVCVATFTCSCAFYARMATRQSHREIQ